MSEPFIGEIKMFPYTFAPRNWAWCQGQSMDIASNVALYSIISTTYGGDGRRTMALPDLKGRAPMHPGRGVALTPRYLGEKTGTTTVSLTSEYMPSHNHPMQVYSGYGDTKNPANALPASAKRGRVSFYPYKKDPENEKLTPMSARAIDIAGESMAHENQQPYLAINFCIALTGIYPSRS